MRLSYSFAAAILNCPTMMQPCFAMVLVDTRCSESAPCPCALPCRWVACASENAHRRPRIATMGAAPARSGLDGENTIVDYIVAARHRSDLETRVSATAKKQSASQLWAAKLEPAPHYRKGSPGPTGSRLAGSHV